MIFANFTTDLMIIVLLVMMTRLLMMMTMMVMTTMNVTTKTVIIQKVHQKIKTVIRTTISEAAAAADNRNESDKIQPDDYDDELPNQHFTPSEGSETSENQGDSASSTDDHNKEREKVGDLNLESVDYDGRRYLKGRCYHAKDAKENDITIGIKSFKSEEEAHCVEICHIETTFLGGEENSEYFVEVMTKVNQSMYVQKSKTKTLHLSKIGDECTGPYPHIIPDWIYEPRRKGNALSFGYVKDNKRVQRTQVSREEIFLVEAFSGAGGMHLGYADQGFTTRCAVEIDKVAVKTFKKNNPGVPVYAGDVNDFINEYDGSKMGRIDVIHTSSPCQGFSKANINGGENDETNNKLSYSFVDLLRITGALVGVFENVPGMWEEDNIRYLHKILIGAIALGYQVRVQKLNGTWE